MWNRWTMNRAGRGRVLVTAVAVLALAQTVPGRAGDTSEGDRKALLAHLEQTEKTFLASIEGLNEAQWKWKAGPDRWSVAEVAERVEALVPGWGPGAGPEALRAQSDACFAWLEELLG